VVKKQISINVQSGYGHLNMTLAQDIQDINFKVYNDFFLSHLKNVGIINTTAYT
jgi:hypothetical protein